MSACVYQLFDRSGRLLYVGTTTQAPRRRVGRHRIEKPWRDEIDHWTAVVFPTVFEARQAERHAIFTLQPRYNVRHKTTDLTYRVAAVLAQPEMSDEAEQRALASMFQPSQIVAAASETPIRSQRRLGRAS